MNNAKVGLVLSGGGAKGAYQVGVLRYIAESGMNIDAIAGASIGALNGAVIASASNINEASEHLNKLWQTLANESPLKIDGLAVASYLGYFCIMGSRRLSPVLAVASSVLTQNRLNTGLLDNSPVKRLIEEYTSPEKLSNGLPLYVSIFESRDSLETVIETAMGILGIKDTNPSEFRHVQSFPAEQQRDVVLASASLPLLFAAQEIDGKRYADGGIGGWQKSQGNTPITPLITEANCSHVIVTHLTDGSLWNRYDFPDTTVLEVRPKNPITQEGMLKDVLNFKADKIHYWIEQGYEDASRCIGDVARVLKQQAASSAAITQRNAVLQALDDDGFSLSLFKSTY
ncbi:MAG: patatin-like phospholipase family protein [Methylococcales bacterium]|nr:patatin-like phospholipase family protein [Methylococcales bacterium]